MTTKTTLKPVHTCTYIGPDADPQRLHSTCSQPSVEGRSYCIEHMAIVYQKGTANRKRKKDIKRAAMIWDIESEFNTAVEELEAEGLTF